MRDLKFADVLFGRQSKHSYCKSGAEQLKTRKKCNNDNAERAPDSQSRGRRPCRAMWLINDEAILAAVGGRDDLRERRRA